MDAEAAYAAQRQPAGSRPNEHSDIGTGGHNGANKAIKLKSQVVSNIAATTATTTVDAVANAAITTSGDGIRGGVMAVTAGTPSGKVGDAISPLDSVPHSAEVREGPPPSLAGPTSGAPVATATNNTSGDGKILAMLDDTVAERRDVTTAVDRNSRDMHKVMRAIRWQTRAIRRQTRAISGVEKIFRGLSALRNWWCVISTMLPFS